MASIMYNEGNQSIIDRDIDLAANTIKAMLVNSTYTPNKNVCVPPDGLHLSK